MGDEIEMRDLAARAEDHQKRNYEEFVEEEVSNRGGQGS